jgi:hypothetical protein
MRRKIMQEVKPWTKTSRYIQEHAEKGKVAKKAGKKMVVRGKV